MKIKDCFVLGRLLVCALLLLVAAEIFNVKFTTPNIPSVTVSSGVHEAFAAVTPNSVVTPQTPTRGTVQFLQGTDTAGTYKTLYTVLTNGARCNAMWSTNNDASATHLLTVQIVNTAVKYGGTSVTTTINQGFANGTAPLNLMSSTNWPGLPLDSGQNPYLQLVSGDTLQATFATALTAGDVVNIVASCQEY